MRQSVLTFSTRILIALINFPISIIIARKLGAEGQGAYSATVALTSFWATAFLFGIDTAHTYYLASKRYSLAEIMTHAFFWSLILGVVATPLYIWVAPLMNADGGPLFSGVLTLSALAVPLILLKYFLLSAFLGNQKITAYNLITVASNLVLLAILLVTLVWRPGGIRIAVISYLISLAVFAIVGLIWVIRRVGRFSPRLSSEILRESLSYGLKGHLGSLAIQGTYRLDQILITGMIGLQAQGFYSIAVLLAEKLSHVPSSVQLVLFPRVSSLTDEEANKITPMACRTSFLLVIMIGVVLFLVAQPIIELLYSKEFAPAVPALRILVPGVALLSVGKILSSDLSGRNRRLGPSLIIVLAFLVNLTFNLLWIPRYGIEGAAWASTLSYGLQTVGLTLLFWKVSGVPPQRLLIPQKSDLVRLKGLWPGNTR